MTYLNRADVQKAIHANMNLPYKWSECSSVLNYSRFDLLTSVLPVYDFLIEVGTWMRPHCTAKYATGRATVVPIIPPIACPQTAG